MLQEVDVRGNKKLLQLWHQEDTGSNPRVRAQGVRTLTMEGQGWPLKANFLLVEWGPLPNLHRQETTRNAVCVPFTFTMPFGGPYYYLHFAEDKTQLLRGGGSHIKSSPELGFESTSA